MSKYGVFSSPCFPVFRINTSSNALKESWKLGKPQKIKIRPNSLKSYSIFLILIEKSFAFMF